jgi:very-short-patch-repair endonuclease
VTLLLSERQLLTSLVVHRLAILKLKWGQKPRLRQWQIDTITETERLLLKLDPSVHQRQSRRAAPAAIPAAAPKPRKP